MGIFHGKKIQKVIVPFKNEDLIQITTQFCLDKADVHKLYQCFNSFQKQLKSYLTLDDMVRTLHHGYLNFAELPYLQYLFSLISSKTHSKIFFPEYLTGICTFCLMNSQAILRFVFEWIDKDCNDEITIEAIISAVRRRNKNIDKSTFFDNFIPDIERIELGKDKVINFEQFRKLSNQILFIIWPAYELQEKLRQINIGSNFWKSQYSKIQASQIGLKNSEKKAYKMQDRLRTFQTFKRSKRIQFISIHDEYISRKNGAISSDFQLLGIKKRQRRNSCPYLKAEYLIKPMSQSNDEEQIIQNNE